MWLDVNGRSTYTEKTVKTNESSLVLRQIAWIGHSGRVYGLDDNPGLVENGGFSPVWVIAHADAIEKDESEGS